MFRKCVHAVRPIVVYPSMSSLNKFLSFFLSFFLSNQNLQEYEQKLSLEKTKQESLIGQLKDQLEEMERCVTMVWKIK